MICVDKMAGLYRGPRPTDVGALRDAGIKRIISLESGVYDLAHSNAVERQFPCDFGMLQYDLKSSDFIPPEPWAVGKFLALMKCDPMPTYIHCKDGVDRTGYMCAVYRMRVNQWRLQAAIKEWKELGRHPWYFIWEPSLRVWK